MHRQSSVTDGYIFRTSSFAPFASTRFCYGQYCAVDELNDMKHCKMLFQIQLNSLIAAMHAPLFRSALCAEQPLPDLFDQFYGCLNRNVGMFAHDGTSHQSIWNVACANQSRRQSPSNVRTLSQINSNIEHSAECSPSLIAHRKCLNGIYESAFYQAVSIPILIEIGSRFPVGAFVWAFEHGKRGNFSGTATHNNNTITTQYIVEYCH